MRLGGALAAVVAAVGIVAVVLRDDGPDYPDAWDARVVELVAFVEEERGHDFEHPVPIDFLTPEEYAARTRTDAAELTDEELAGAEQTEGLLRAMGLVDSDIDLLESSNDLSDTGTLAFYDSEIERVIVRGTEITPDLAVTMVHELTHVLQDQVFGLDRLTEGDATSGELAAFRGLVEGDAVRIQNRYEASLDPADQEAIAAAQGDDQAAIDEEGIPEALQAIFALPYALGEGFVSVLEVEGDDAIDDAFEDPPTTEEHLLDPFAYLDLDEPTLVLTPEVDDAELIGEGDFGAASLFLVLATRIDQHQALDAALGWGGDAYVGYLHDDVSCMELDVLGDTPADSEELAVALEAWSAAGAPGSASVTRDGERTRLHTCDPGAASAAPTGSSIDAVSMAATRTYLGAEALRSGARSDAARCYADGVVHAFSVEELTGTEVPPDLQDRLTTVAAGCQ